MPRICAIFNPTAARRSRAGQLARFRETWEGRVDFLETSHPGHAAELAEQAARDGYQIVSAVGGDGTSHEVASGLLRAECCDVTLAVIPLGSSNDYAWSIKAQFGQARLDDETSHPVDVGRAILADGTQRPFMESLGVGLSAMVNLESRAIHGLRGPLLYGLAAWRALRGGARALDWEIGWNDEPVQVQPTMLLTALIGRREGSFRLAPQALLDDGKLDVVRAGQLGRWQALRMLPGLAWSGPPKNHPQIQLGQCRTLTIRSPAPLTMHVDGEILSRPEDGVLGVDIELLPQRLRVKTCAAQ